MKEKNPSAETHTSVDCIQDLLDQLRNSTEPIPEDPSAEQEHAVQPIPNFYICF